MGNIQLSQFSSQANPEVLNQLHHMANTEGRTFHDFLDEALRDFLIKKGFVIPSPQVTTDFAQSLAWQIFKAI